MKRYAMLWLAVVLLGLSACGDDGLGLSGDSGLNPSPQLTLEEADQVAGDFLTAWAAGDYKTMYSLISPNSRDAYIESAFADEYANAATEMTLTGLESSITNSLRQGTTAVVMYDVTFTTELFAQIADAGRTMRLIETPDGWRVAWSRMDIFADLAEGARLELRRTQPGRGNIYDRNGQVLVDQNGRAVLLYIVENDAPSLDACMDTLSRILRRERGDIQTLFDQYLPETRFFVGETDPETYQFEEQALRQLCGIGDQTEDTGTRTTRRYYGELAPHVVGYVSQVRPEQLEEYEKKGYPADALIGQEGIEMAYEDYLAGTIGGQLVITSPTGQTIRAIAQAPASPGQSVYLTIDRDLQAAVQQAMIEAYNYAQPTWAPTSRGAAAVVMDVKTGEILAMVSYPWFNPSLFNPDSPVANRGDAIAALRSDWRTPLLNRTTMGLFPAGSVFKIASMAAGLDSGVYNVNTLYTCSALWSNAEDGVAQRKDWIYGQGVHGTIDFPHALTYSCDPYFWELGFHLHHEDPELLPRYAYEMGLGVATGQTDLPEEIGYIPNPTAHFRINATTWAMADTLNLVIGQGQTQITPLQITRMTLAVANGGVLYKPQFVSKIQLIGDEPVYTMQPTPTTVLDYDPSVFEAIQQAMCDVTLDPTGTARYMFEEWYTYQADNGFNVEVCGKTGTAQTGDESVAPQAWFSAFAPQDDPEIAIAVIVENSCEGSEVAAPLVRRIVEDYYHMPHSEWPPLWQSGCAPLSLGE